MARSRGKYWRGRGRGGRQALALRPLPSPIPNGEQANGKLPPSGRKIVTQSCDASLNPARTLDQPQPQAVDQKREAGQWTSTWKRVPRELRSIGGPWLDNYSSSSDDKSHESLLHTRRGSILRKNFPHTPARKPKQQKKVQSTPREERARRREKLRYLFTNDLDLELFGPDFNMASQQGKWREEQVLVICPGSQTTMAQLGCSELTPPAHRIPTRMFKDEDSNEYRPYRTYKRKKVDVSEGVNGSKDDDEWEWVEDRDSVEGAIHPIEGGRIVNMEAFLAFLDHVHSLLTTTYHNTPIVLMASPQWTRPDCESIARYIFEKTKTPALCLLHSAVATQYGLKWPSMTIVDIGFEKVDVTCIYDNLVVSHKDLGFPTPVREISGGEVFTRKLWSLLKDKGFTYDMAEQLKKSPICEVLPYVADSDDLMELPTENVPLPTGPPVLPAPSSGEGPKIVEPPNPPPALGVDNENEVEEREEGVLDVANIVTSGNTREFLAKREKEKTEKIKTKKQGKGQEAEPTVGRPLRLPNSKRKLNMFHYEDLVHEDVEVSLSNGAPKTEPPAPANGDAPANEAPAGEAAASAGATSAEEAKAEPKQEAIGEINGDNLPPAPESTKTMTERRTKRVRKDIEVGLERFLFADRDEINRITDTIYRTVQNIDDIYKRSTCWDNIIFVGNGSRLRGLKENIIQTLSARHLISPSTATIFTSELPSNMATPTGTGSQTPTGSFTGQLPTTSSVNPLLQAATTASLGVPGSAQAPGSTSGDAGVSHHSHGQTPMSIKQAALPTYLAEWTKNGFEEAMFLGSLVAARLAFCIHNFDAAGTEAQRLMSLNRVDYNENGPKAIRTHSMMG